MATYIKLLPQAVRTSSVTSGKITVWEGYPAAHIVVDHPNIGGGITVVAFGQDRESGFNYTLLSSNIVASGHTLMKIGPEYTAGANIAKEYLPYEWYISVTASGTNSYGIGVQLVG